MFPGSISALLALLLASSLVTGVAAASPDEEVSAVVAAFSKAITDRKLDAVLGHLATKGVQYNLRPAHTGLGNDAGLTSDLTAHWTMVAPVLFSATKSYTRKPQIIDVHVDGDIATAWAQIETNSVPTGNGKPRSARFVELYLLVRQNSAWKIAAIADNRRPDPM